MQIKIEAREVPSKTWQVLSPIVALLATAMCGILLFGLLGKSPFTALTTLFVAPLASFYGLTELAIKAAPILLYAVGLAVCFQAKVWNIGAEGQFTMGAIFASAVAILISQMRIHLGVLLAIVAALLIWVLLAQTFFGFQVRVVGSSLPAANYAGIERDRIIWLSLLISGGLAGLAGACEVFGPIGQLRPTISPGYGYAAIIAAFIGRLNLLGIILSTLLLALLYVGGELLQIKLTLPLALAGVFQGILFLFFLAADFFIFNRIRIK